MTLLAIDPGRSYKGDQTIGWAIFQETGEEVERGIARWEDLFGPVGLLTLSTKHGSADFILSFYLESRDEAVRVHELVIEDFVNDPKSARGGQRNGTSECIGGVEVLCLMAGVPCTRQRSDALGPAKLHAGYTQTLQHLPHQDSAYLHGYEYLVRNGRLQSAGLSATL